jgi:hypothetical protein
MHCLCTNVIGMAIATAPTASRVLPDICDEHNCREATSHPATCRCSCGGDGHGLAAQVDRAIGAINFQARRDVTGGFTGAMLRETDDCEAF